MPIKVHLVKAMVFPVVSHVWMWELDYKESWVPKNWCFWTVLLKILESPLDCKEIKPVNRKGNQSWIFIGRTDAEAETPILGPPDAKNWLIWKDTDAGKDWMQEKQTTDEMVGWHHQLDGHEFEQALGVGDGQGSLTCCSPWSHRVGHDWTELSLPLYVCIASSLLIHLLMDIYVVSMSWLLWVVLELWWTGKPGVLQSMGLQWVKHDWVTELNWICSVCVLVTQYNVWLFATPCTSPGSSVHGILQARILEWVAIPFSRGSSWLRDQTWVSLVAGRFFTIWATREALTCSR